MSNIIRDLAEARKAKGLSLRAVAEKADVYPTQVSQIERGIVSPNLDTLEKLAKAYGKAIKLEDAR